MPSAQLALAWPESCGPSAIGNAAWRFSLSRQYWLAAWRGFSQPYGYGGIAILNGQPGIVTLLAARKRYLQLLLG
jgi:hypothetical protein